MEENLIEGDIFVCPLVRSTPGHVGGLSYIEVNYLNTNNKLNTYNNIEKNLNKNKILKYISFDNYYTSSIVIQQKIPVVIDDTYNDHYSGNVNNNTINENDEIEFEWEWKTCLKKYNLMNNIHSENDAMNHHILNIETLFDQSLFHQDGSSLFSLKFYLFQPSPLWQNFELHNIQFWLEDKKNNTNNKNSLTYPASSRLFRRNR